MNRRSDQCFVVLQRDPASYLGNTELSQRYCGVDRQEWNDFDRAHYAKMLPRELEENWIFLDGKRDRLGLRFASFAMAKAINDFSTACGSSTEISAVRVLDEYGDAPSSPTGIGIEWLGVDIFVDGYGSAILQGILARPDQFESFQSALNSHGLFDFHDLRIRDYQQAVIDIGRTGGANIEVMPNIDDLWHALAIGRPTVQS